MTLIIGITGGIGSGKSTLVEYLRKKNFYVHDSDEIVKKIYEKSSNELKNYLVNIGLQESIKNKKINKKIIADKIFSNNLLRKKLENFIHKKVQSQRNNFINHHRKKKSKIIFVDIPLLFEKNLDSLFDKILCILCPKNIRMERVVRKKNIPTDLFKKIIKDQVTNIQRKKRADYCIVNDKTKKYFYKKIDFILRAINI